MQEEAVITINGIELTELEAMTIRVAVDTLANVLAEDISAEPDGPALAERYMGSLAKIQLLLERREARKQ